MKFTGLLERFWVIIFTSACRENKTRFLTNGIFDFHFRFGDTAVFVRNEAILARGYSIQCLRPFTNVCGAGLFFLLRKKKKSLLARRVPRPRYRTIHHFCSRIVRCAFLVYCCRETRIISVLAKVCFNCQTTNNYKKRVSSMHQPALR